ncbi:protein of unknown function (plasmid) [Shinella sp. WSC3-e]|nr:hypothetical protein SHINE37_100295 [Rhizobiaceae bacterium]CAK7261846.1 protein of unknown function [Shinella sp. WSC3-e]
MIVGDPDLVQDAIHKERGWFASEGQAVLPAQIFHRFRSDSHDPAFFPSSAMQMLSGDRRLPDRQSP